MSTLPVPLSTMSLRSDSSWFLYLLNAVQTEDYIWEYMGPVPPTLLVALVSSKMMILIVLIRLVIL